MELKIIYEDKYILCLKKPQGVPSQSDKTNDEDLMSSALKYIESKEPKPYLGLIQRLDRPVGGAIVFAKQNLQTKSFPSKYNLDKLEKNTLQ